jgi:hypothetical protein
MKYVVLCDDEFSVIFDRFEHSEIGKDKIGKSDRIMACDLPVSRLSVMRHPW